MAAVLVILTIVAFVALDILLMAFRRRRGRAPAALSPRPMLEPRPPQGVFLDPAHAWVRITTEGTLRVGIDEFLAGALGEVDAVQVPPRGTRVQRGDPLITLRVAGKEIRVPAPAAGEVMTVNENVLASPYLVSRDAYGVGWIVGLWTPDHQEAIRPLRIGATAIAFLRSEVQRFVEFLGAREGQAVPVLADGGLPLQGAVRSLAADDLQAFQDEFLTGRGPGA